MSIDPWVAGVDLGGTKIKIIQVGRRGEMGKALRYPTEVSGGAEAVSRQIVEAVEELSEEVGRRPEAVGIGVAGQVDGESGAVKFAPNLKWRDVPLQEEVAKKCALPVVVTNDVRAAAWGEWLYGAGKGYSDLLLVFIGTGIGGAIVSEGRMIGGYNNTAGEIGHITASLDGPRCSCGNRGCMEVFAAGWGLAERAKEALAGKGSGESPLIKLAGGDREKIEGHHVMEAALSLGDPVAERVVGMAVEVIAAGVSGLVNSISPERVIFGGGVVEGNPWLIERCEPIIRRRSLGAAVEGLSIVLAELHNDAGAIGAAALAISTYLTEKGG